MSLTRDQPDATDIMRTLSTRLRKARELRRMTQGELAKQIQVSAHLISMIENGKCGASIRTMVSAASVLNVSLDYLAGLVDEPQSAREMAYELRQGYARILDLEGRRQDSLISEDTTNVNIANIATFAEFRASVGAVLPKSKIAFPSRWLDDRNLRHEHCRVTKVTGEAMEPTLPDGCSILLDLMYTERSQEQIYVVLVKNELIVRRATWDIKAGWLLVSDNPDKESFPTRVWPDDARILARVVWCGQSFMSIEEEEEDRYRRRTARWRSRSSGL